VHGNRLGPQDYSSRVGYRPPARWYAWLNAHLGAVLGRLGLLPPDVVSLEVVGRTSGAVRRTLVVLTRHRGSTYLVALAGESQWVRNVRAADGHAVLRRGSAHPVRLVEIAMADRPPVLAAYLSQAERRGGRNARARQAESYFGLPSRPSTDDLAGVAAYYPVFLVHEDAPAHGSRRGGTR
jgi:deazaflavin-dependent oxidoreductase (nitroreductase family)